MPTARSLGIAFGSLLLACGAEPVPPQTAPRAIASPSSSSSSAPSAQAATLSAAPADASPPLPDDVHALQDDVLRGHGAVDAVTSLTTEVGGRLAGSPADRLAVSWATRAMQERGFANVHAEPVKVPVWERGIEAASIVSPTPHPLAVAALGWSGATPARGVEAEVVRFASLDALQSADPKALAGKIAFLDVSTERTVDFHGYAAAVVARSKGPAEARKKGALALVLRSIGTDASRFPHTGSMQHEKDASAALPAGALSIADASLLAREIAAHGTVRLRLQLGPRWLPEADSANVVGEVAGTDRRDEVVVLGAHLDSWDLAQGAIDDGAGCGIVLEAGRALAALPHKPRRTVRVVLFAAEENSLAGGKTYAKAHEADLARIVAAIEADAGTARVVDARYRGAPDARSRFTALGPLLSPLGIPLEDPPAHGGSDISPLLAAGVPILDLGQDVSTYFDTHHTANDTLERIEPQGLQQAAAAFATAAWAVATMDGDFGRVPEAERNRD